MPIYVITISVNQSPDSQTICQIFFSAWGSGIKRIFNSADEYGLSEPRIQVFDNMFRVELFRNPLTAESTEQNIGEASEKHRRNVGEASENRNKQHSAKNPGTPVSR